MALMHVDFFSDVLGMCMDMDVIIPQKTRGQIGMEGTVGVSSPRHERRSDHLAEKDVH